MNLIKVLTKRNVALLLGAQAVSAIGSVTQSFALSLFVLGTGSGVKFATVLAVGMIPRLFGPLTGVVVDGVSDVLTLEREQLRPVPTLETDVRRDHLLAIGAVDDRMLILLDIEKLLAPALAAHPTLQ